MHPRPRKHGDDRSPLLPVSAALSPERLGRVVRIGGVENQLHWSLNAVMHEGRTRNPNDNSAYDPHGAYPETTGSLVRVAAQQI